MKHTKIGKGYYQSGYGRGFKKLPTIYLIDGKAYAKDNANYHHVDCDKEGYVNVNSLNGEFAQCWPNEHKEYTTTPSN